MIGDIEFLALGLEDIRKECSSHPDIDGCDECKLCVALPGHEYRLCLMDWPPSMWPKYLEMYELLSGKAG